MSKTTSAKGDRARFSAVDQMSGEMFDKLGSIERPEQAIEEAQKQRPNPATAERISTATPPKSSEAGPEHALQVLFQALLRKAERFDSADLERAFVAAHRKDIGPAASRRRSKLPEGIDLIEGQAAQPSEEDMMAAIRRMMTAQKRDFSLKALPHLEPAATERRETTSALAGQDRARKPAALIAAAKTQVAEAFRKDFVLAANVAFWGFLGLFLFLNPQLSLVLFGNGVFFLLAVCFVFMPETLADLLADLWRRVRRTPEGDREN